MQLTELTTSRLQLKPITPAYIHEVFNTKTDTEIRIIFGCNDSQFELLSQMHLHGMETFRISQFHFLLLDKETDRPLGECGFHTWTKKHRRAELFYNMFSDEQKQKGLMREALQKVLEYGFTELDLHRVEANVAYDNTPSIKLLQRYGFVKEGVTREDYCVDGINEDSDTYSLLRWEWKQQQVAEKHNLLVK